MCLITCILMSFCDSEEIRMAFFLAAERVAASFQPHFGSSETLRFSAIVGEKKMQPTDARVRAARGWRISAGVREFLRRSVVPRTPWFGRGAAPA